MITRKQFGDCTMIHADCLDVLPIEADAIVTDPPYKQDGNNHNGKSNSRKFKSVIHRRTQSLDSISRFDPYPFFEAMQKCCWQSAYFFCNKNLLREYLSFGESIGANMNLLVWRKHRVAPIQIETYRPDVEYIVFLKRKGGYWNHKNPHSNYSRVFDDNQSDCALHAAQKPISLCQKIIINSTIAGATVLDPYMGSGTTAIACIRTGRKFIGIEKDAKHFQTACDRVENELRQGILIPPQ